MLKINKDAVPLAEFTLKKLNKTIFIKVNVYDRDINYTITNDPSIKPCYYYASCYNNMITLCYNCMGKYMISILDIEDKVIEIEEALQINLNKCTLAINFKAIPSYMIWDIDNESLINLLFKHYCFCEKDNFIKIINESKSYIGFDDIKKYIDKQYDKSMFYDFFEQLIRYRFLIIGMIINDSIKCSSDDFLKMLQLLKPKYLKNLNFDKVRQYIFNNFDSTIMHELFNLNLPWNSDEYIYEYCSDLYSNNPTDEDVYECCKILIDSNNVKNKIFAGNIIDEVIKKQNMTFKDIWSKIYNYNS